MSILATVFLVVSSLYIDSFRESRRSSVQNQVYEDARYVMNFIAKELRAGTVDYDEYYNQLVVGGELGQNYGAYFSSFYNPGSDGKLGFKCNNEARNSRNCIDAAHPADPAANPKVITTTKDEATGTNPFSGKFSDDTDGDEESAFCADMNLPLAPSPSPRTLWDSATGQWLAPAEAAACDPLVTPAVPELYIISADGKQKPSLPASGSAGRILFPASQIGAFGPFPFSGSGARTAELLETSCAPMGSTVAAGRELWAV